ncbi:hypothetical protein CASFOL_000501 [Castilleja foliolosa]|uniref:Uncharacterized protein n=1 Tax=Castilleja foliolosa TaxID=1961234 RepID=A0ABD3EPK6_9LAMI
MGAPLAPVDISTADNLPHLSIKNTSIVLALLGNEETKKE